MSSFFSNVLKLVSGSVIAQILGILLVPIVTRLIPNHFGIFQLFISLSSIVAIFACLSYQFAIMLPKDDEDSANIVVLCFILITIISVISACVLILFSDPIGKILNAPQLSPYLIFLPLIVFLSSVYTVRTYWLARRKQYGTVATTQVINAVSSRIVQIGTGLYSVSPMGLIFGWIVGYSAALGISLHRIKEDLVLFRKVTIKNMRNLAIRYKRFPIFSSWSTTANTISNKIIPLILVYFFNPAIVGSYALANTVVFLPMGLIGTATSQVFFQKAAKKKTESGI